MPAFIYFFKLLYPFHLSNSPQSSVAAAAGGCILIKRSALETISGFEMLKNELIDDCALALKVKSNLDRSDALCHQPAMLWESTCDLGHGSTNSIYSIALLNAAVFFLHLAHAHYIHNPNTYTALSSYLVKGHCNANAHYHVSDLSPYFKILFIKLSLGTLFANNWSDVFTDDMLIGLSTFLSSRRALER